MLKGRILFWSSRHQLNNLLTFCPEIRSSDIGGGSESGIVFIYVFNIFHLDYLDTAKSKPESDEDLRAIYLAREGQ
jgi:hypothetical protein